MTKCDLLKENNCYVTKTYCMMMRCGRDEYFDSVNANRCPLYGVPKNKIIIVERAILQAKKSDLEKKLNDLYSDKSAYKAASDATENFVTRNLGATDTVINYLKNSS